MVVVVDFIEGEGLVIVVCRIEEGGAKWSRVRGWFSGNHAARGANPLMRVEVFEMASTSGADATQDGRLV